MEPNKKKIVRIQEIPHIYLTPPSVLGSLKVLDERFLLERPTSSSASALLTPTESTSDSIPIKMSQTGSASLLTTCVEQSGDEEQQDVAGERENINIKITAASPLPSRKSSLKLRRGSSKKKKTNEPCQTTEVLNNCKPLAQRSPTSDTEAGPPSPRDDLDVRKSSIQSDKDVLLSTVNCIKNNTSPRINVRRSSSIKSDSHQYPRLRHQQSHYDSSKQIKNNHYSNLDRKNSINVASLQHPHLLHQQYYQRRMSSIEHTFGKHSDININNFGDFLQNSMKIDLEKSTSSINNPSPSVEMAPSPISESKSIKKSRLSRLIQWCKVVSNLDKWIEGRDSYSLYYFSKQHKFRRFCTWFVEQKWFDNVVLLFIALNCITLAMERPNIPPWSNERYFLGTANYVFTVVFAIEMLVKVVSTGMFYGKDAYFTSGWNIMDGSLVMISIIDLLMGLLSESSPRIFGILRVFRLLRSLRPLRVINRAPGLKLVVQTLLSSLRPIGNIVLICCTFFIIFGILGVQLFKGTFFYCEGENIKHVRNKEQCLKIRGNVWINRKYNFDDLGKALMSLFVLSSRDGWVNIMYTGLDAVGVDQQVSRHLRLNGREKYMRERKSFIDFLHAVQCESLSRSLISLLFAFSFLSSG